jgi:hypothetical protein
VFNLHSGHGIDYAMTFFCAGNIDIRQPPFLYLHQARMPNADLAASIFAKRLSVRSMRGY